MSNAALEQRRRGRPHVGGEVLCVALSASLALALVERKGATGQSKREIVEAALAQYLNQDEAMIRKPGAFAHWKKVEAQKEWEAFAREYDQLLRLHYLRQTDADLQERHLAAYPWSPAPRPGEHVNSYPAYIMEGRRPEMYERDERDAYLRCMHALHA